MAISRATTPTTNFTGPMLADQIFGLGGNDILIGLDGDDLLEGGAGADELFGSDGFDYASYKGSPTGVYKGLAPHASVTEVRCIPRLGRCVQGTGGPRPSRRPRNRPGPGRRERDPRWRPTPTNWGGLRLG